MQALLRPKCHDPRDRKRGQAQRELPHCERETGPAPVQIIKTDKHGILERGRLNEGLHVLQEPEQELRRSVDVIKRAPISERQIPLKQRVEQGTQLDYASRLGCSSPDPERELSSHRYALVEQPRLAEPGASLHHHHATGPSPDLVQPLANDRELLLTSAEGRTELSAHFPRVHRAIDRPAEHHGSTLEEWAGRATSSGGGPSHPGASWSASIAAGT